MQFYNILVEIMYCKCCNLIGSAMLSIYSFIYIKWSRLSPRAVRMTSAKGYAFLLTKTFWFCLKVEANKRWRHVSLAVGNKYWPSLAPILALKIRHFRWLHFSSRMTNPVYIKISVHQTKFIRSIPLAQSSFWCMVFKTSRFLFSKWPLKTWKQKIRRNG